MGSSQSNEDIAAHVIRCGVNVREEDEEEKEDTAVSGHL